MTLTNITDKEFHDCEVQVEGCRFIHCSFLNCKLVVNQGRFEFHRCIKKDGTTVIFGGEALKCVQLEGHQDDSVFSIDTDSTTPLVLNGLPVKPGRMLQFYLMMFLMMLSALAFLFITMSSPDPLIHYGGPIIAGHIVVALIIFALYHYFFLQKTSNERDSLD